MLSVPFGATHGGMVGEGVGGIAVTSVLQKPVAMMSEICWRFCPFACNTQSLPHVPAGFPAMPVSVDVEEPPKPTEYTTPSRSFLILFAHDIARLPWLLGVGAPSLSIIITRASFG